LKWAKQQGCVDLFHQLRINLDLRFQLQMEEDPPPSVFNIALYWAREFGLLPFVKAFLLDMRVKVDPSSRGQTPLFLASARGHVAVVKWLLADPRITFRRNSHDILLSSCSRSSRRSPSVFE
jgi:ankyrin repeat protein